MAASCHETPMMKQYLGWKERYPEYLLFFRMGDFYETFLEDAKIIARELDLTLTARDKDKSLPMAGVPWHSVEGYLARLTRKGYRVAICEQVSEPDGKSLVDREVVRLVTPGTFLPSEGDEQPQLAALLIDRKNWHVGFLSPSSPRVGLKSGSPKEMLDLLTALSPAEILTPRGQDCPSALRGMRVLEIPRGSFDRAPAYSHLTRRWNLANLRSFGLEETDPLVSVAGALISYLEETSFSRSGHVTGLTVLSDGSTLMLDGSALRHLDLIDVPGNLYDELNCCRTAGGARMLRHWVIQPSRDLALLARRQDAVAILLDDGTGRGALADALAGTKDVERALARLHNGTASPRDLAVLRDTLAFYPSVRQACPALTEHLTLPPEEGLSALRDRLCRSLLDPVPRVLGAGPLIAPGVDEELDRWREVSERGDAWLSDFAEREKKRLGVARIKITYSRVFGYGIEVSKSQLAEALIPEDYQRRQTLVNAERFVCPELKDFEDRRLRAETAIREIENRWFDELVAQCREHTLPLQQVASALAEADCLCALAEKAEEGRWVRPQLGGQALVLKGARHPLVEVSLQGEPFVPFDVTLDRTRRLALVTGPNMAGKSTFLRAVGLLQALAQMGSFVPALSASFPVADRLFTRVGARDELMRGNSTFMVEMLETANILNNATEQSLVILDEVGRGTATFDGMSIAWAVVEYLAKSEDRAPLALFATHYHELTDLQGQLPGLFNLSMAVADGPEGPIFTHRLVEGPASRSYGVEVARLAGLPRAVVARAGELLAHLESQGAAQGAPKQQVLFDLDGDRLIDRVARLDPDGMSPKEALETVYALKQEAQNLRRTS